MCVQHTTDTILLLRYAIVPTQLVSELQQRVRTLVKFIHDFCSFPGIMEEYESLVLSNNHHRHHHDCRSHHNIYRMKHFYLLFISFLLCDSCFNVVLIIARGLS